MTETWTVDAIEFPDQATAFDAARTWATERDVPMEVFCQHAPSGTVEGWRVRPGEEPERIGQNLPDGTHLAYTLYHETSWWAGLPAAARPNGGRPTIQVTASAKGAGGGVAWEFAIVEYQVAGPTLHLEMFAAAFPAFEHIPRFFENLPECDTLESVQELLAIMGAVDETERAAVTA